MSKPKEINRDTLQVTAVVAGGFEPRTSEIVEYVRRFGGNPMIDIVNEILQMSRCITHLSPDLELSNVSNSATEYFKGMRTMMPGENAKNCKKVGCRLIDSCTMALFAVKAESRVRELLDPKLADIVHVRI